MITDKNKHFLAIFGSENHIDKLVNDEHDAVRAKIAQHPNLQPHHIDKLVNDEHDEVRAKIARHPRYQEYIKGKK